MKFWTFAFIATIAVLAPVTVPAEPIPYWTLHMSVQTGDGAYHDTDNGLGGRVGSIAGYDSWDAFEFTPPMSNFVILYFMIEGGRYSLDNREYEVTEPRIYNAEVWTHNLPNVTVTLTWPNIGAMDPDLDFTLLNAEGQPVANMRQVDNLSFAAPNLADGFTTFDVRVAYDHLHAMFRAAEPVGPAPLTVQFEDLSSPDPSRPITAWRWDLDGDGDIDSADPEPIWSYNEPGLYSVSLTVDDGVACHTSTRQSYVQSIAARSDILVINGIYYPAHPAEMTSLYGSSAVFGSHDVDVWDLFGAQEFAYEANPLIRQVMAQDRDIPDPVLRLYGTVIWVVGRDSSNWSFLHYRGAQVIEYLAQGGSFLLAAGDPWSYLPGEIRDYCGITGVSNPLTVSQLVALDPDLVNMPAVGASCRARLVTLSATSEAIPIFRHPSYPDEVAGFRIQKQNQGTFVYVAGDPYRYETSASYHNYNYMLDIWAGVTRVDDRDVTAAPFRLLQNRPNPFNPETQIRFSLLSSDRVSLRVYDVAGRLVRILLDDYRTASEYSVSWDGKDDAGADVASGVYIYRLATSSSSESRRMVLAR